MCQPSMTEMCKWTHISGQHSSWEKGGGSISSLGSAQIQKEQEAGGKLLSDREIWGTLHHLKGLGISGEKIEAFVCEDAHGCEDIHFVPAKRRFRTWWQNNKERRILTLLHILLAEEEKGQRVKHHVRNAWTKIWAWTKNNGFSSYFMLEFLMQVRRLYNHAKP